MTHYPVFLDLTGMIAVLIGDQSPLGQAAEGRAPSLIEAGATIRRVAPTEFQPDTLDGASLVVCGSVDEELNARVAAAARERRIFCNIVDRPALCSWIAPAIVTRSSLQIAISTGGKSPALAVRVKEAVDAAIGPEYAIFLDMLYALRDRVREQAATPEARAVIFQAMARGPALDLIRAGRVADAERELLSLLR